MISLHECYRVHHPQIQTKWLHDGTSLSLVAWDRGILAQTVLTLQVPWDLVKYYLITQIEYAQGWNSAMKWHFGCIIVLAKINALSSRRFFRKVLEQILKIIPSSDCRPYPADLDILGWTIMCHTCRKFHPFTWHRICTSLEVLIHLEIIPIPLVICLR